MPAPGELQLDTGELGKYAFEKRPGSASDVPGHAAQIGAATTEQQAVVWRAPKIIEDELVVGDAHIAWQQRGGQILRQRLGCDLIGADRQHATRQLRIKLIEVSVARQHQHIGANTAALGGHHVPVTLLAIVQRLAEFMDAATGLLDGVRQAEGQFQRIQMPAFGIEQSGLITLTGHPLR
ncbi:hypothetical protein D3C84_374630 [compost metagenome]